MFDGLKEVIIHISEDLILQALPSWVGQEKWERKWNTGR